MTAGLKRVFGQDAAPSPEAANIPPADPSGPAAARAPEFAPIVPPRGVRRTRLAVLGVALVLAGWLGYLAFQQWLLYTDPLARAITVLPPRPSNEATGQLERAAEPAPAAPPPVVLPREPKAARPAPPPVATPRLPAPASSAPRVTHTLREDPKPVAPAAAKEVVVVQKPAPAAAPPVAPCTEAVAALGLCGTAPGPTRAEGK